MTLGARMGWVVFVAVGIAATASEASGGVPACIGVRSEARWVPYGYNHVVVIEDRCPSDASCVVSTDVNPTPQTVTVKAGTSVEVLTFAGSPASRFVAKVDCGLVSRPPSR